MPACAPSGGAGGRDAAGPGGGVRGRQLLRPFRHRDGRRDSPAAAHDPGVRQPDLRAQGRRGAALRVAGRGRPQRAGRSARPAWAPATTPPPWRSAMRCTSTRRWRTSRRRSMPGHTHPHIPDYHGFDDYRAGGGYKLLEECLDGTRDLESILTALEGSSLRGLGGAGFPTGRKWRFVRAEPGPRLMAINGDEGEPGTFKDRHYLETDPNRFLEGMLIGAWAVEATDVYIYLRDEYPQCREILDREIAKVEAGGPQPAHQDPHAARRRGLYLRRGIGDAGKHRGQARPAAPQAALPVPGGSVRPADADQQHRNRLLGPRHRREGTGVVVQPWPQRAQGPAQLFRLRPRQGTRRQAGPGRHHHHRTDRRVLRRDGGRPHLQGLSAGWRFGRHPAGQHGRYPAGFRHAGAARLLHRLGGGRRAVRQGRYEEGRPQPDEVLRG